MLLNTFRCSLGATWCLWHVPQHPSLSLEFFYYQCLNIFQCPSHWLSQHCPCIFLVMPNVLASFITPYCCLNFFFYPTSLYIIPLSLAHHHPLSFCHPRYPLNMSMSFPKPKWDILFRSQGHLDMTMDPIPLEET